MKSPKNNGSSNPNCSANTCAGNPINTATGNKYEVETDFVGGPSTHLEIKRYYNSQNPTLTAFGPNWRGTYDRSILFNGGTSTLAQALRPDGRVDSYTLTNGAWVADADVTSTLTSIIVGSAQTGWQLVTADDTTETYNMAGKLVGITTRAGLTTSLAYDANNNLTTVTGPFGHTLTYAYNASGQLASITAPNGGIYAYAYNTAGTLSSVTYPDATTRQYLYQDTHCTNTLFQPTLLTSLVDEKGATYASWTYDAQCRATSSQHAGGVELTTITYNAGGTTTVTDPRSNAYTYGYQNQFGLIKPVTLTGVNSPTVGGKAFSYDANGFMASKTDFNNNVTHYAHDTRGDLTSVTEAYGTALARTTATTWHTTYHLPTQITEPTRTISFTYDAQGNLLTKTQSAADAPNRTWSYTYNAAGQVLTANGPRTDVSDVASYTYDSFGNLTSVTNALGQITSFTSYDANGRLLSLTDPNGLVTNLTYDARGRLASRSVGGETTSYTYDAAGNLTVVTLPDGSSLTQTYDAAHRLTDVTDSLGNHIHYTLDAASNRTREDVYDPANALKRTRGYAYDSVNRLAKIIGAANQTTTLVRDGNGNVTSVTDPLNNVTTYAYDALNRVAQSLDPLNGVTSYQYNPLDEVTQVTSPRGLVTSYTYNGLGDSLTVQSPDTGLTTRSLDAAGNVLTSTDAKNQTTTFTYDALNRRLSATYADATHSLYAYDGGTNGIGHLTQATGPAGDVVNFTYDSHGRTTLAQQLLNSGRIFNTAYAYDLAGRMSSQTYPSGLTVGYGYDTAGQVSALNVNGAAYLSGITHEPFGPVSGWNWAAGTGSVARPHDTDGRLASYPLPTDTRSLTYDNASRVVGLADSLVSQTFSYDGLSHLLNRTASGSAGETYTYDADGNRLTKTDSTGTTNYTLDAFSERVLNYIKPNSVTVPFMTDANGSVTSIGGASFAYNARGRQSSTTVAQGTTSYTVDALDRRVVRNGSGGGWFNSYDLDGSNIGDYSWASSGSASVPLNETIRLPESGGLALPVGVATNGASATPASVFRIYAGHLNEPRRVTDVNGALRWSWDSDTFGVGSANQNPSGLGNFQYNLRFPGQAFDPESANHYNVFRDYLPAHGRYGESDPIGLQGGINPYVYVAGNPVNGVDRFGLLNKKLLSSSDPLNSLADSIPSVPGRYSLAAHGGPYAVSDSNGTPLSVTDLAKIITHDPAYTKGMPVDLYSCRTGEQDHGIAQKLSDTLKAAVTAPDTYAWSHSDGRVTVSHTINDDPNGQEDLSRPGSIRVFLPQGQAIP